MTEDWTDDFVRRVANEINNLRSAGLIEPQEIADMLNVQERRHGRVATDWSCLAFRGV